LFSLTTFYKKHFRVRFFKIDATSVKQDQKVFLSAAKGVVANSGISDSSLLFLFRNGCGSAVIKFNK